MKNLLLGLVLGILLTSVPVASTQQETERIYIGSTQFALGMQKDTVISRLAEQGYKLTKMESADSSSEGWAVNQKNEKTDLYDFIGSLSFRNGRLSWALRESWDTGSAKVGKNLYFLTKSFEESGNTACSLETGGLESPEFDSKETIIHCGKRTITINVSKYKEQSEETQVTEIVK